MALRLLIFLVVIYNVGCHKQVQNVGDIAYDVLKDDPTFKLCNENQIRQYYARHSMDEPGTFKGEKHELERQIHNAYSYPINTSQNGYVTIRFVINCKGETGRYRMEEMNSQLESASFNKDITNQLLAIVKNLQGWVPRKGQNTTFDTYQYLTFKIENGQITHLLP